MLFYGKTGRHKKKTLFLIHIVCVQIMRLQLLSDCSCDQHFLSKVFSLKTVFGFHALFFSCIPHHTNPN